MQGERKREQQLPLMWAFPISPAAYAHSPALFCCPIKSAKTRGSPTTRRSFNHTATVGGDCACAVLHTAIRCCRYSSPFFYNPSYETDYEPVSGTVSPETPAKYSRINWGDFRLARFAGDYAGQRSDVHERYTLQYSNPCSGAAAHQCSVAAVVLVVGATAVLLLLVQRMLCCVGTRLVTTQFSLY